MMGLQATTTKRKYEIGATDDEKNSKIECSPPKSAKITPESHNGIATINSTSSSIEVSNIAKMEAVIPPGSHPWSGETDSISKLQAVAETWGTTSSLSSSNSSVTTTSPLTPLTTLSSSITLSSLAQTAENITRSTLATTLLDRNDLMDDDDDDFQDDYDFDDEEDLDDLEDQTPLSYSPIRYPSTSLTNSRNNYIPAYPKSGYPEPYQNCSRTPTAATHYSQNTQNSHQSPRPPYYNGSGGPGGTHGAHGNSWAHYYNQHYESSGTPPPQTIRCAENGKSYFELGSASYCNVRQNGVLKNCCDGRNNLYCTAKQCYKEKRLKMMNLSMFKLARFRQASDQSLYRSVLICNTLKSLEKEIEHENKLYHQQRLHHQQQHHHHQQIAQQQQQSAISEYGPHFGANARLNGDNKISQPTAPVQSQISQVPPQQQQHFNNNTSCGNYQQSYNFLSNRGSSFNESSPPYDHHPLKDPSSGRATPFPVASVPQASQLASASPAQSTSSTEADSGFGDVEDDDTCSSRTINWGSLLTLSSQSALDPLNSNDLFTTSHTKNTTTVTSNNTSTSPAAQSVSTPPATSIITTLTTVSSCSLESLTASTISITSALANSNWDFPYLDMDLNSSTASSNDLYELFPNCYKLTSSAFSSMDDFIKSQSIDPITPAVANGSCNELEQMTLCVS